MEQTALFSLGERSTQVSAGTDPRGGPEQEGWDWAVVCLGAEKGRGSRGYEGFGASER